jgi:peptide-N4-(N-acetyl-beta-glucosaminyl)asparagine amidase
MWYIVVNIMLGWSSLFSLHSDTLKDTFLLYKRVTEQYENPDILKKVRSLIPQDVVLQAIKEKENSNIIVPLLKWFKNDFMKWTPKEPICKMCINRSEGPPYISDSSSSSRSIVAAAATSIMQVKKIIVGDSWNMRKVEIFVCKTCNYEYAFPRYGEILKIAEAKTGRCSEWSMLFGAMLSSLGIKTRIVHDFLDHCWNEAMLSSSPEDGRWVHVDSTLDYPISLNHPNYYEENWKKEYEYVLAFTADKVEDVTQRYTLKWETIQQRRLKNKNNAIDFSKVYSGIR